MQGRATGGQECTIGIILAQFLRVNPSRGNGCTLVLGHLPRAPSPTCTRGPLGQTGGEGRHLRLRPESADTNAAVGHRTLAPSPPWAVGARRKIGWPKGGQPPSGCWSTKSGMPFRYQSAGSLGDRREAEGVWARVLAEPHFTIDRSKVQFRLYPQPAQPVLTEIYGLPASLCCSSLLSC